MTNIIDIRNHSRPPRKCRQGDGADVDPDDLPDITCDWAWDDPASAQMDKANAQELDGDRIPAIMVKGCFALYHLVREHKQRHTRVPKYLLGFARIYEDPLIPTAETVYEDFFDGGCAPGEIPEHLLDVGLATADDVAVCVRHAMRLHYTLEACANSDDEAPRDILKSILPRGFALHLLLGLMLASYRSQAAAAPTLKPV